MTPIKHQPTARRGFLQYAAASATALLAGLAAPIWALASALPCKPGREKTTAWVVDFLLVPGRKITLFAREADAKRHALQLIRREIEGRQVRDPAPILQRIAAGDMDGAIAAYRHDQRSRAFGGEVNIFEERVAQSPVPLEGEEEPCPSTT